MKESIEIFKEDDKVIVDNGITFELGVYVGVWSENDQYLINITTGLVKGEIPFSISHVKRYSKELVEELSNKYKKSNHERTT